jgi:hypothetical protein
LTLFEVRGLVALPDELRAQLVVDWLERWRERVDVSAAFGFGTMAAGLTAPVVPFTFWYGVSSPSIRAADMMLHLLPEIKP